MTKEIPLTQGKVALVDDDMHDFLMQWKWCLIGGRYAARFQVINGKRHLLPMHRIVMHTPKGYEPDHINGNKLDNRRENLRPATRSQNMANRTTKKRNTHQYKGIKQKRNRFEARIKVNKRDICLGHYATAEEAARAYDRAALQHFGEFARPNFPESEPQP